MSAEPVGDIDVPTPEQLQDQITRDLTDEFGERIVPACESSPDLWFSTMGRRRQRDAPDYDDMEPEDFCARCPAQKSCGAYAIIAAEQLGIWGGRTGLGRGSWETRYQRWLAWTSEP